jgi:hypothetical protein
VKLRSIAVVASRSCPRIFCNVGRLIPFCKAVVANVCRKMCGLTSRVIPARSATARTTSWARRTLTGNAFSRAKWCSRRVRTRGDIGTTRTLARLPWEPALPLILSCRWCQRTFPGCETAELADAEAGVGEGPETSRSVADSQALDRRSDSSMVSGSLTY